MFDFIANLDGWAQWLLAVGGGAALIGGFWRWLLPKWRGMKSDARAIRDTLIGRPPMIDSITGQPIPGTAVHSVGTRVDSIEKQGHTTSEQLGILTRAVADMAASQERLDALERNHADLAQRVTAIERGHFDERMAGKIESIQLLSTIETVAKAEPYNDDDHPPAA